MRANWTARMAVQAAKIAKGQNPADNSRGADEARGAGKDGAGPATGAAKSAGKASTVATGAGRDWRLRAMRGATGIMATRAKSTHQSRCRVAAFMRGVKRMMSQPNARRPAACQKLLRTAAMAAAETWFNDSRIPLIDVPPRSGFGFVGVPGHPF